MSYDCEDCRAYNSCELKSEEDFKGADECIFFDEIEELPDYDDRGD